MPRLLETVRTLLQQTYGALVTHFIAGRLPHVDRLVQVMVSCLHGMHVLRTGYCEQRPKRYLSDYRDEHFVEIRPEFLGKALRS